MCNSNVFGGGCSWIIIIILNTLLRWLRRQQLQQQRLRL